MNDRHLVVVGPMGVGKTTLACRLGERLDRPVRDSDSDLQTLFGRSGRAIADTQGIDGLHELEAAVLLGALASRWPLVIAAAGWVVEDPRCRAAMARRAMVAVLDLSTEQLLARLAEAAIVDNHRRPMTADEVRSAAERRRPLYQKVGDCWLDASRSPDDLVTEILAALDLRP